MKTRNRRDRSRISGEYPLRIRRGGGQRDETVAGTILDVATGGFCVSTERPLLRGEHIILEIVDQNGAGRDFAAAVIWCDPDSHRSYRAGAEFLEPLDRQHFIRLCALTCGASRLR